MRQAIAIASKSFKTRGRMAFKEANEAKFAWELEKAMREGGRRNEYDRRREGASRGDIHAKLFTQIQIGEWLYRISACL
jgi:hypothetical protein